MIVEGTTQKERSEAEVWIRALRSELERVGEPATEDDRRYVRLLRDKLQWFEGVVESSTKPA